MQHLYLSLALLSVELEKTGGYLKHIKYVLSLWLDTGSFLSSFFHGGQKHAVLNWSPNVDMQMPSKGRPIEKGCLWGSKRHTLKLNKIRKIESFQKLWAECKLVSVLILRPGDQFNVYLHAEERREPEPSAVAGFIGIK